MLRRPSDKDGHHLSKPTMCMHTPGASYTKFFVNTVWLFNNGLTSVRKEKLQALRGSETCLKIGSSGLCQDLSPACLQVMPFSSHPLPFPSVTRTHWGNCPWSKFSPIAVDPGQVAGKETGSLDSSRPRDVAGTAGTLDPLHFMLSSHCCVSCPLGTSQPA